MTESERDGGRCVACGVFLATVEHSLHHRILGNRKDNRASNRIYLCGSGTTRCHGGVHAHPRLAREDFGYIVSRHRPAADTTRVPVYYNQPGLRVGWFLLGDDCTLTSWEPGCQNETK